MRQQTEDNINKTANDREATNPNTNSNNPQQQKNWQKAKKCLRLAGRVEKANTQQKGFFWSQCTKQTTSPK